MSPHPVQFQATPTRIHRMQVALRLAIVLALAMVGCSSVYWFLYLALPVLAALLLSRDGAGLYLTGDAPRLVRILRWLAGAYGYVWLLTDALPGGEDSGRDGAVRLTVDVGGRPTVGSALLRLLTSLPALVLLALLTMVAAVLWVVGAGWALATEHVPPPITDFFAAKLRYQFRLLAYHLSLVDEYPTLADSSLSHADSRAT